MTRRTIDRTSIKSTLLVLIPLLLPPFTGTLFGGGSNGDEKNRPDASALPESCRELAGRSSEIGRILREVVRQPSAARYNELGQLYIRRNERGCAIAVFQAALQLDHLWWDARYNL